MTRFYLARTSLRDSDFEWCSRDVTRLLASFLERNGKDSPEEERGTEGRRGGTGEGGNRLSERVSE